MKSKHKNIGQLFKDNILRVCFWGSALTATAGGLGFVYNAAEDHPQAAKNSGKLALWSLVAEAATLVGVGFTGKKIGLGGEKDIAFQDIPAPSSKNSLDM